MNEASRNEGANAVVLAIAFALVSACGDATPRATGPADFGPAAPGHVPRPPFECTGALTPVAPIASAASSSAVPTPPPSPAQGASKPTSGLAFDPRADRTAQWSAGRLVVRSAKDGAPVWQGAGTSAMLRYDAAQLAAFEDGALVVRELPSGTEVLRAPRSNAALDAAWSDDGTRIWVIDSVPSAPASILYDLPKRASCRGSYPVPVASATSFVFALDRARAVATWPGDGAGAPPHEGILLLVEGAPIAPIAMTLGSPNGDRGFVFSRTGLDIAAIANGVGVFTWDARSGKHRDAMADSGGTTAVALSDDGVLVAGIAGARVRLWDAGTTKLVRDITPSTGAPVALAFVPGKRRLAITTEGGGAEMWDLGTGEAMWKAR